MQKQVAFETVTKHILGIERSYLLTTFSGLQDLFQSLDAEIILMIEKLNYEVPVEYHSKWVYLIAFKHKLDPSFLSHTEIKRFQEAA